MTMRERFEEMREHLFSRHHEEERREHRHDSGSHEHHEHRVDQSAGSEFLDMI